MYNCDASSVAWHSVVALQFKNLSEVLAAPPGCNFHPTVWGLLVKLRRAEAPKASSRTMSGEAMSPHSCKVHRNVIWRPVVGSVALP